MTLKRRSNFFPVYCSSSLTVNFPNTCIFQALFHTKMFEVTTEFWPQVHKVYQPNSKHNESRYYTILNPTERGSRIVTRLD